MASSTSPTCTTVTNPDDVERVARTISEAFAQDPFTRYLYLGKESRPDHPKLKQPDAAQGWFEYWQPPVKARFDGGGIVVQACDFAATAIWLAPGTKKPQRPGPEPDGIVEYREKFDAIKAKFLKDRPHWYLNLIGRSPTRQEKGAVRAVFEPYVQKARQENVPCWLEATNQHAVDVYTHLGFHVVDEVRLGKGVVDKDGWAAEDGEGVPLWAMMIEAPEQ